MPEAFASFYVFTAVRRFMFFLDLKRTGKNILSLASVHSIDRRAALSPIPNNPPRTGRISIERLVGSRVMEELMELAMLPAPAAPPGTAPGEGESPQEAFMRQQRAKNWFSAENALRVYNLVSRLAEP